jgi:hypothetical protein
MFALWVNNGMPQTAQNTAGTTGTPPPTSISSTDPNGAYNSGYPTAGDAATGGSSDPCANNGSYPNGGYTGTPVGSGPYTGTYPGTTSVSSTDTAQALSALLNPQGLVDCRNLGKVYDRANQVCTQVPLASDYQCNDAGVEGVFQRAGINVQSTIQGYEQSGFQIDQCGELNGDPLVYFILPSTQPDGTVALQIKKLCKQGSPACA